MPAWVTAPAQWRWFNKAQRLAAVDFVDELPRNGIGKVLKRSLRERWLALGRRL